MKKKLLVKKLWLLMLTAACCGFIGKAQASGFQLFEQNAVNIGDFTAGGAAIAEDASTAYYNPAGLTRICNQQLVISGDAVITDGKFNGVNVWRANNNPLVPSTFSYTEAGNGIQGGTFNVVPAIHYAAPLFDQLVLGFSVASPFGLQTNYPQSSALRYTATESKLRVIDLSPSFGFQVIKPFSVGAGVDFARIDADLNSVAGLPINPLNPTRFDTLSKNEAYDWGYGWHAGALYQFNACTRIGLAYHSSLKFNDLRGTSKLIGPLVNLRDFITTGVVTSGFLESKNLRSSATLPPWTTLSIYHDFNPKWGMDGSIIYTQWNKFNDVLVLRNVQSIGLDPATGLPTPTTIDVSLPQNFHNTWRFALGGIYRPFTCLLFRAGAGFDQTPTNRNDRSIRLPDANRYALAVGAHYQIVNPLGIDVGWTHFFIQKTRVSSTQIAGSQASTAIGDFTSHADVIGAQLTWNMT